MPLLSRLARLPRVAARAARFETLAHFRAVSIRDDTVLYEAFAGSGVLCNPEAIFRALLDDPDFSHLRHVWVLDRRHLRDAAIVAEFRGDRRVRFVLRGSLAYYRAVSTSKYLINNATFPVWFAKRPGQVYLNTWHGTPVKAMGFDMPDGGRESANTLRNFVAADYLLAQNSFMTTTMYGSAYKLQGHFRGRIIEEGYPRVERQCLDEASRAEVLGALASAGLDIGGRRIVLYAPTWQGPSFNSPFDDIQTLLARVTSLQDRLGDKYVVLLKTHQVLERFVSTSLALRSVLAPGSLPTNRLLGLVDTLVTDYSSIFFDFLATGRRTVFFSPDASLYEATRGAYFRSGELPGPVCTHVDDVARWILEPDPAQPGLRPEILADWQRRFVPQHRGSTLRVIDIVFRGRTAGRKIVDLSEGSRTSVLLHVGNLASNGITSAALNLLAALPAHRYDVSVAYTMTESSQQIDNSELIAGTARQFPRQGGMNGSKLQHLRRRLLYRKGAAEAHRTDARQRALWDDEWQRCFGSSRFDAVVDFSGYSPLWATLLLHSPGGSRAIWLHNDMTVEVGREVAGRHPLAVSLPAIFGLYPEYDSLVAVSPALAAINQKQLAPAALAGRTIAAAVNLVDSERILRLAAEPVFSGEAVAVTESGCRPRWVDALQQLDACVWFVTVGRYTREKNQSRLLSAFAEIHAEDPRARLLLVGHGPLARALEAQVDDLGLDDVAFVTGALRNPFSVLRRADCFVLSSDYEGQPMVLLEAAVLGMPIVSTEFGSISDALPDSLIHIVPATVGDLADGLREFLQDGRTPPTFDVDDYNARALRQFVTAVGLAGKA